MIIRSIRIYSHYLHYASPSQAGFSLPEVMIALTILTFILTSGLAAVSSNLKTATLFTNELTAINLAQEGAEIIRNIRDNAWHSGSACFEGAIKKGNYSLDYNAGSLSDSVNGNPFLKRDSNGFYNYSAGTDSNFKREIEITDEAGSGGPCSVYKKKIVAEITWTIRGEDRIFVLEDYLYDWK